MVIIGITGSIGMGKTTVSKMLQIFKIPVFDSDKKVKKILEENKNVINKISKIWPDTVLANQRQKKINKEALSYKVFNDKEERKKLEKIIHPLVEKERGLFLKKVIGNRIVGLDVPLLYETGMDKKCDYIFLVNTTRRIQKKRVLMRPNMTERKFVLINKSQWSLKKKTINGSPFIISTSYGKTVTFFIVLFYLFKIKLSGK